MLLKLIEKLACDDLERNSFRSWALLKDGIFSTFASDHLNSEQKKILPVLEKILDGKARETGVLVFQNKTRNKGMMTVELDRDHWIADLKKHGHVVVDYGDRATAYAA